MTNQNEIDKRIVEAAKEWADAIGGIRGFATPKTRALFDAVQASKPKPARRGLLYTHQNGITDMPPAIEATDAVLAALDAAGVEYEADEEKL